MNNPKHPDGCPNLTVSPQNAPPLPTGPYDLIYADPPWQYRDKANAGKRSACHKYPVMTLENICALPIASIAADDCLLAMWHVPPMPVEALAVVHAWGFTLRTMKGFTWVKRTRHGKHHFGMGHWTRANSEDCLIATRGRPVRASASVRQVIEAPVREHSRKPDEVRDRLLILTAAQHPLELFARETTTGWTAWGNQVAEAAPA